MSSVIASIGKNLILLGILFLSGYNFFYGAIDWKDVLAIQSLAGVAYVFLSCYEFLNASFKASLPVQRFPYFTNKFLMFRVLKVAVFFGAGSFALHIGKPGKVHLSDLFYHFRYGRHHHLSQIRPLPLLCKYLRQLFVNCSKQVQQDFRL